MSFQKGGQLVRCDACPGRPILPARCDIDTDKCVRCQGWNRRLPVPHPTNHLCGPCSRECPQCSAPTKDGDLCRACRKVCRGCGAPVPERPAAEPTFVEADQRRGGQRRWRRVYWPTSLDRDLCDDCRGAKKSPDPVRAVLAALPDAVLRACGGTAPPNVLATVRAELHHHRPEQLASRIERRWYGRHASLPLLREATDTQEGWRPDDVALALVAPSGCPARCDDGWMPDNPDLRCPTCRNTTPAPAPSPDENREAGLGTAPLAERPLREALTYRPPQRECEGRDGACGVPVAAPYTQCPSCLDWPTCRCGRRYDPDRGTSCLMCSAQQNG